MVQITQNELIVALQKACVSSPNGMTTREIVKATGRSDRYVISRIKDLLAEGLIEVGKRQITDIVGRKSVTYEYRLKRKKK